MLKHFIIFLTLTMLLSCGKSADEATAEAILTANIALSKGNCQTAITILEANGRINNNAAYLKTLSSAYACKAGYSTLTFFTSDLAKTVMSLPVGPLGGTTTYTTSSAAVVTTLQDDQKFKDLQTAIDILLYAGGIDPTNTDPTSAERAKYFTTSEAADIDSQLLYMVLVQLGRYMYHYGDSSATARKGSGPGVNNCFTTYVGANGDIKTALNALAGTCTAATAVTHPELSSLLDPAVRKKRLCQGVVLLNGVFAILPNVVASVYSDPVKKAEVLAAVSTISLAQTALKTFDPTTTTVASTLNQSFCEDASVTTSVSVGNVESYFAMMFEGVLL